MILYDIAWYYALKIMRTFVTCDQWIEGNMDSTSCDWKIGTLRTDPNILGRAWEGWVACLQAAAP